MTYSIVTYIMTRHRNSCFIPPFFTTLLFSFDGLPLEMLVTFLFAFTRLSANSHEKSRSVFSSFCGTPGCCLCLLYNIQPFTFAMSTICYKTLTYHLLAFTDILYNAISITAIDTSHAFTVSFDNLRTTEVLSYTSFFIPFFN